MYTLDLELDGKEVEVSFNVYAGEPATYDYPGSPDEYRVALVTNIETGEEYELEVQEELWVEEAIEEWIQNNF